MVCSAWANPGTKQEETSRRWYPTQPQCYCGSDLHARARYVCILHQHGELLVPRHRQATLETCLHVRAPSRAGLVVAVEWLVTWAWLADLCAHEGLPCVLGPALSMKARHGGQAQHDTIDAHKSAVWRRGGMLPPASGEPAQMRATRARLRRRRH